MRITKTPDPMVGQGRVEGREEFGKQAVEEYSLNKASFKRFPLRHYRQLEFAFDGVGELLGRLRIPTHITGLVFGGYTGQFANALREMGMTVIFTDPMEDWVTKAKEARFEAYCYSAQSLPGELLDRCQIAATFECYFPIGSTYSIQRLLAREYGLLFAESKQTRIEMLAERPIGGLLNGFFPYFKVYSIKRARREKKGGLRFYHFCAPNPESREMLLVDVEVMKAFHDTLPDHSLLTVERLLSIPAISRLGKMCLEESLNRILELHYRDLSYVDNRRLVWAKGMWIGAKCFRLEEAQLAKLESSRTRSSENGLD